MKSISALIMILLFAAFQQTERPQDNYEKLWKQVEKKEQEGLPKSALELVETIFVKAEKAANSPQIIKCLLYKSKFMMTLEEEAQLKVIGQLNTQIEKHSFPTKNILEGILAQSYWQYFSANRYRFYDRTNTENKVDESDFRTWDLETLFTEIASHYENALENEKGLQNINLSEYDAILTRQENSKKYRPTLYDLLAHQALQFYETDENSITKPAYKFEIDDEKYLGTASEFAKLQLTSKDSTSLQLKALQLYKRLIAFHQKSSDPVPLVDVNIARLRFVNNNATSAIDEETIIKTLAEEANSLSKKEVAALYDFERARYLENMGDKYASTAKPAYRWKRKEALDICKTIISKYPESLAAKKAKVLANEIQQPFMSLITEKYVSVDSPFRILIDYQNHNSLEYRIHKITSDQAVFFERLRTKTQKDDFIKKLSPMTTKTVALKNEGDFQKHGTEIAINGLANGFYFITTVTASENNVTSYAIVQATDLALLEKSTEGSTLFQVVDRNNGKPIKGATVDVHFIQNDLVNSPKRSYTSDANGEVSLPYNRERSRRMSVHVTSGGEKAYFGNFYQYYYGNYNEDRETSVKAFLFTDRSIYRPGQTVHFKGIFIKNKGKKTSILPNEKVKVALEDVNGQEVGNLTLASNEFGSFTGTFVIPRNTLTGSFTLLAEAPEGSKFARKFQWSRTSISVEEYKRPKFETSFELVTETYKINDSITIKGTAKAYAGSNITDAKVVYRVKRLVQFPRWYYWSRPWFNSEPQEITYGETITKDDGSFEITFKAQPDESVDKEQLPVFEYEVTADVTDINGETRSATTLIRVGYHSLLANMNVSTSLNKEKKDHKITITTQNLNGQFAPAKGQIRIYKLQAPSSVLRSRPWGAPDYQSMDEAAFKKEFPHDAYKDEDDPKSWKKGTKVFEEAFDTDKAQTMDLGKMKRWESGKYQVELTCQDPSGREIKDLQVVTIFSPRDDKVADKQLFTITVNQSQYKPGDVAKITLGTAAKEIFVTLDVQRRNKSIKKQIIVLRDEKKTIEFPITQKDVGGFSVLYSLAAYNSHVTGKANIQVPYPSTDLQIETVTFRDKLLPGQQETWTFKVKGPKGDKVSAELLASMYDASLDEFRGHYWSFNPINYPYYFSNQTRSGNHSFGTLGFDRHHYNQRNSKGYPIQNYDQLNWFGFYFGNARQYRFKMRNQAMPDAIMEVEEMEVTDDVAFAAAPAVESKLEGVAGGIDIEKAVPEEGTKDLGTGDFDDIPIRKNLQETAFFFPQLQTDASGNVSFSFTTPEALTRWKLQLLGHTKELESATTTMTTVTQKELMVLPNPPRFFRESDTIIFSSKISNLTKKTLSGEAILQLVDPVSGKSIDGLLSNANNTKGFTVDAEGNTNLSWTLNIPKGLQAVQYKVIARAGDLSDGEQNALPVLTNRMLVTETVPMWVRSDETRTFELDKLKNNTSTTLTHHRLSLEITSNPAWYAVQALPYLMEYPYECAEQTFARYYANALASHIANSNPRIKEVFDQWRDADALISNLEKNEELKALLIQETPWLRDAQSETEQKKRIALLFDLNTMNNELASAQRKLEQSQLSNGAWSWFKGGNPNRWITQHIGTGYGHLKQLGVQQTDEMKNMVEKAMGYLDSEFVDAYERMKERADDLSKDHLSYSQLHYLYMRSFFSEIPLSKKAQTVVDYYEGQCKKYWLKRNLYSKGMIALVLHRMNDNKTPNKILRSLKENSITNDELGMYWKENTGSWFWHQAPIETQAMMIETFGEISNDVETIDNLKVWLLKNKQTNQWKTTKATTEAIYALLLQGSDWLSVTEQVDVTIGNKKLSPETLEDVKVEAGTGYYKTSWSGPEVTSEMATVTMAKKGRGIAWGGLYWQYFEDLDKITFAETPLKLKKQLFLKKNTDTGEQISAIDANTKLEVGDLIRVRIELRSDRDMEFVHMKDMRAAGLEPIDVISTYKWQDGLGYYQSTKDAATNFFFDYLRKGVYVFEYDLRVNNAGSFSNGITTIQSMYAPEFTSHSEGVRITVSE